MLAACRCRQILGSGPDCAGRKAAGNLHLAAFQQLEQPLGMLLFLIRYFLENRRDLHKAVLFGLAGKKGVAIARLGFAGKGGEDVLFGFS